MNKYMEFENLHNQGLFLLPNAWNGGSAKVFEKQGFKSVGTTSAGIAYSMGYGDGEKIEFEDIYRVSKEIIDVVEIPVTIDIERGFSESPLQVKENVKRLMMLGVVGINIEDGCSATKTVDDIELFASKIKAIKSLERELNSKIFVNARTDIYLLNMYNDEQTRFNKVVERAKILKDIGANCIFIPGALDEITIRSLRTAIELPINLYLHPSFNDSMKMDELGINRLSSGSAPVRTIYNYLINISKHFNHNYHKSLLGHGFSYNIANDYFKRGDEK